MTKLISLFGLAAFLCTAWALSTDRKRFPFKTVAAGLGLQLALGVLVLKTSWGAAVFGFAKRGAEALEEFAAVGAQMVFGPLASPEQLAGVFGEGNTFIFVVTVSSVIILVSSLSTLLYHWGVLPKMIQGAAWVMTRIMKTSGAESLAAAANIFAGQTEAALVVRPYLAKMTQSELMSLMTGGMATIAGSVFIIYVLLGVEAGHLLTASVMSAPAALVIAKIMIPETEASATAAGASVAVEKTTVNAIDALCSGASEGVRLAINVIAMLIAFTAVVAMVNALISAATPASWGLSLQTILGWINAPFAFLMGIPWAECPAIGQAMGERIVLNEFIGYLTLTDLRDQLSPRGFTIASYALCGFANLASVAIQIGGISALEPETRPRLAQLGLRSMAAGLLACYTTACIAGILI